MELNAGRHMQAGSKLPRKDYEVSIALELTR